MFGKTVLSLLIMGLLFGAEVYGQGGQLPGVNDPGKADLNVLNSEGELTAVKLEPKGKSLSFFVVGKEKGRLDMKKFKLVVRQMASGSGKILETEQNGNEFHVVEPVDLNEPREFEVLAKTPKKTEIHHFKIYNRRN